MKTSKYTGVSWRDNQSKSKNAVKGFWLATIQRDTKILVRKTYTADDERGAARAVDLALLKAGYEPVNGIFTKISVSADDFRKRAK